MKIIDDKVLILIYIFGRSGAQMVEAYPRIGLIIKLSQVPLIEDRFDLIFHCKKPLVAFAFFVMLSM